MVLRTSKTAREYRATIAAVVIAAARASTLFYFRPPSARFSTEAPGLYVHVRHRGRTGETKDERVGKDANRVFGPGADLFRCAPLAFLICNIKSYVPAPRTLIRVAANKN